MILQIVADARPVEFDRDAELEQIPARADPGEEQELCRADRAGRQNDFAPAAGTARSAILAPAHAGRAPVDHVDAFDQASGFEPQVLPVQHRLEEAARRGPAPPARLIDVKIGRALIVAAIEIVDRLDAVLLRRLAERIEQFPLHARRLDAPLSANAMMLAVAEEMASS